MAKTKKANQTEYLSEDMAPVTIAAIDKAIVALEKAKEALDVAKEEKKIAEASLASVIQKNFAKVEKVAGNENHLRYVSPKLHIQAFCERDDKVKVKILKAPEDD